MKTDGRSLILALPFWFHVLTIRIQRRNGVGWFCYTSKRQDHTAYPATQPDLKFLKHRISYVVKQEIIFNPSGRDWTMQQWKKSTHGDIAKSFLPLLLSFTRHSHGVQKIYMASFCIINYKPSNRDDTDFQIILKMNCYLVT